MNEEQLKTTVWYIVNQIAQKEAESLDKTVSKDFVASLADIVYKQIETMALDLEAFARHGKRSVISMEDVKLCARRNEHLLEILSETATRISSKTQKKKKDSAV